MANSMNTEKIADLNTSVAVMQARFSQIAASIDHLEKHYEKINEIYSNMLQVMSVHQEKIERYALEDAKVLETINEIWDNFKEMKVSILTLREDINNIEKRLTNRIADTKDELIEYSNETHESLSRRTGNLEKVTYLILAGVIILSFFLANADKIGAFFKAMVLVAPN